MLKLEHHVQFLCVFPGILLRQFCRHTCGLAHGHDIIPGEHALIHLPEIVVHIGSVYAVWSKIPVQAIHFPIRHLGRLGDHADHIHAKTVNALLTPPPHHVKNLLPHLLVIPV